MIAFVNALEILRMANQVGAADYFSWSVLSVDGLSVTASNGLAIPTVAADRVGQVDVYFVCGGNDVHRTTENSHLELVKHQARIGTLLGGICTGAYVLAKAGLLKGYKCTIHWEYRYAQTEKFFDVEFEECIYKIDRDRLTCAGGIAPLEMMLSIVKRTVGTEVVAMISNQFSVDSLRSADASQKTARYIAARNLLSSITAVMEENIEIPLTLSALSARSGLCERQLTRTFKVAVGQAVMQYYRSLRLRHAQQLLMQSGLSLTDICVACGFQSHSHFTTSYRKEFGLTPGQERARSERRLADGELRYNYADDIFASARVA